jgi:hypothetical protein
MPQLDTSLLTAALTGYQQRLSEIDSHIAEIKERLANATGVARSTAEVSGLSVQPKLRRMSAAARRRIAEAQRKRWAAYRKAKRA